MPVHVFELTLHINDYELCRNQYNIQVTFDNSKKLGIFIICKIKRIKYKGFACIQGKYHLKYYQV